MIEPFKTVQKELYKFKYGWITRSINPILLEIANKMGVEVTGIDSPITPVYHPLYSMDQINGYYNRIEDIIGLNVPSIFKYEGFASHFKINETLAHELIHATGNERRVFRQSLYDSSIEEEMIAQFGAMELMDRFNIATPTMLNNSLRYAHNMGRGNPNSKEVSEIKRAVEFILNLK
jgi:hypothetical protein